MTGEIVKILFALVVVVGFILISARIIQSRTQSATSGLLQTLGYLSLGPRRGIAVVKAGKEILLIGITPNDLKLLKTIDEDSIDTELTTIKNNIQHLRSLKGLLKKDWLNRVGENVES